MSSLGLSKSMHRSKVELLQTEESIGQTFPKSHTPCPNTRGVEQSLPKGLTLVVVLMYP